MKRRQFLKTAAASGVVYTVPPYFQMRGSFTHAASARLESANYLLPARMPQVINIFMYGGASELAGNLTNIRRINAISQNSYPEDLLKTARNGEGQVTPNGFWHDAGGFAMEDMLAAGDLSVYRTVNRRKNNTRAHRQSIFSSQKGSLGIDNAPGMGSTIAAMLHANRDQIDGSSQLEGKTLNELVLPFVSFEGTTVAFAPDHKEDLPLRLRGLSLNENFENPYTRSYGDNDQELEALIAKVVIGVQNTRYSKVVGGFKLRARMERLIGNLQRAANNPLPVVPSTLDGTPDVDTNPDTGVLRYPDDNMFSARIKAAVTLAVENPDSLFISLGGGLGGWDDHDGALNEYVPRMNQLMSALRAASKHIGYSDVSKGGFRDTTNIIINVHGDFGRNVNLNNSAGWDHGNNQNLYTIGGAGIRSHSALGKIVGSTSVFGSASDNRLFTRPEEGSFEVEPMSIAASTYQYFGAQSPSALTSDPELNPDGDDAIDESVVGVPLA